MSLLLDPDGTGTPISPHDGERFTLEELQTLVGGDIDLMRTNTGEDTVLVINAVSEYKDLVPNDQATRLWLYSSHGRLFGRVVLCSRQALP